LFETISCHYII